MKLVLSTNAGNTIETWEDIETYMISTNGKTLNPIFLIDEIKNSVRKARIRNLVRIGVVTEHDSNFGEYEVMKELR